ncbi:MAG: histidine--tRNA ligase [Clostridiales Family XIII bacterium]|jgi:histidyl-tRNA synthetase|nr:histidine--tRNA ligase [Clostridiales Family XIII bacterium]
MLTKAPKGTKDILPEEIHKWHYVETIFADICRRFGFSEIRTPLFEHTELFARGVGDTSDIVQKQMYSFEDYGGRSITLRPEGTAGVVRSYIEHKVFADGKPTKYWYEIPCFRYEQPQSGRQREFHQFGIEIFGSENMLADTEAISVAYTLFMELGIMDEIELRINSIGCPKCRSAYREVLRAFLAPKYDELCDTCKMRYEKNPMRILDCKSPICQELIKGAPVMLDHLCDECREAFSELQQDLSAAKISFTIDPGIVRGLDYYTKTAFEFVTTAIGAQGTVCGGGRYDHLIEELGGPAVPGVGFGLGIERLLLLLGTYEDRIPAQNPPDALIVFMGDPAKEKALSLLNALRTVGLAVELDVCARSTKNQFKHADKTGVRFAVILGENELASGKAAVKDMNTGEQQDVDFEALADFIKQEHIKIQRLDKRS